MRMVKNHRDEILAPEGHFREKEEDEQNERVKLGLETLEPLFIETMSGRSLQKKNTKMGLGPLAHEK